MSKKGGMDIPWWLVIVLFIVQAPLGVVALFLKLFLGNGGDRLLTGGSNQNQKRLNSPHSGLPNEKDIKDLKDLKKLFGPDFHGGPIQYGPGHYRPGTRPPEPPRPSASPVQPPKPSTVMNTPTTAARPATTTANKPVTSTAQKAVATPKKKEMLSQSGKKLPGYGNASALTALGTISLSVSGLLSVIAAGIFLSTSSLSLPLLSVSFGFAAPGAVLLLLGRNLHRRNSFWRRLIQLIGTNKQVPIPRLATFTGATEDDVERALETLIAHGYFTEAYIDRENHLFVLGNPFTQTEKDRETAQTLRTAATGINALTPPAQQIRALNDRIAHPQVSQKMYRLEELTEKIYSYVDRRPARKEKLKSFEDYYLPNTLKILEAYANFEEQGISGSNIDTTMADIEAVMDTLVAGFEKTLDNLLADEALDISAEITVLENMLGRDGVGVDGFDNLFGHTDS